MSNLSQYGAMWAAVTTLHEFGHSDETLKDIGARLREAREAIGLSIDEAAAQVFIQQTYLNGLEEGDWSALPGQVYGRGYLRKYADFLGLDGQHLTSELSATKQAPVQQVTPRLHRQHPPSNLKPIGWVLLIILGAFVLGGVAATMPKYTENEQVRPLSDQFIELAEPSRPFYYAAPSCFQRAETDGLWGCYLPLRLRSEGSLHRLIVTPATTPEPA